MPRYHVEGEIRIEYRWFVDEEIEAESEDDAIDAVCEDLDTYQSLDSDTEAHNINVTLIEDEPEPAEDQRMRALGMPMLPGIA